LSFLPDNKIGLVGPNGPGKTTVFRLISSKMAVLLLKLNSAQIWTWQEIKTPATKEKIR